MRVALVGPDLEENLSLRYLASSLRNAGHETRIVAFEKAAELARVRSEVRSCDLVGLSMCYQARAREFLDLADAIKREDPTRRVIAGGHYASCQAQTLVVRHPSLDAVAIHEAERTLVDLASLPSFDVESLSTIRGIVFRGASGAVATQPREILEDLDALPLPDRSGPARLVMGVPTAYMMGSRGCHYDCDYCCISTLHRLAPGSRFRQRSTDAIADEMAALYHGRGVRQFVFHDDNFLVSSARRNLERIDALSAALRTRGVCDIGLVLKCRPGDVQREVFTRLKDMGLLRVFLGIESGTELGLQALGRRQSVEQEHRALQLCEELELSTQYTIIIFHPDATGASIRADLDFVRAHLAHPLSFCRAEAYAGTPLEQRVISRGIATGDYLFRGYRFVDPLTEVIWHHARSALRERLWSCDHLLGRSVQLDHLVAVFGHFYQGAQVDALVSDFRAWQFDVNRDSVALLAELVAECERWAESPDILAALVDDIRHRERSAREVFDLRRRKLRQALYDCAFRMMGLSRPAPGRIRTTGARACAAHAAAALLAVGLIGCGGESVATDHAADPVDASTDAFLEPDGVYEAPPWDGSSPQDAQQDVPTDSFVEPDGVFEAPPWDAGYEECEWTSESPACDACVDGFCYDRCIDAQNVFDLPDYLDCQQSCTDSACMEACDFQYSAAAAAVDGLYACIGASCFEVCLGCEFSVGSPVCDDCIGLNCVDECSALIFDPLLTEYLICHYQCPEQACRDACVAQYPVQAAASEALRECASVMCSQECPEPG